jgi:3alpha(or 20beta)-hydroxysteroid dehydrogenase
VLVTGGARGMGASHGRLMAEEGAHVVLGDILHDVGEAAAQEMSAEGLSVAYHELDVTSVEDWQAAVAWTEHTFGPLTGLVNNAGLQSFHNAPDESVEMWENTIRVNQTSVFYGLKYCVPSMRKAGIGSIVNISSSAAIQGDQSQFAYVAAKHAVLGMTKAGALDHAIENIRVNSIAPGWIDTPMARLFAEEELDAYRKLIPMDRAADPLEVSQAIVHLISDESTYTTGQNLTIDGGLTIGQQLPQRATQATAGG